MLGIIKLENKIVIIIQNFLLLIDKKLAKYYLVIYNEIAMLK